MNLLHVTLELVPAGSPTGVAELMVYLAAQRMEVGGWMATGTVMDGRGTRELAPTPSDVEALGALFADAGFPAAPPEWPAPAGAPSHRAALRVVVDGQQVEREGALAPGGLAAHPGLRAALQRLAELAGVGDALGPLLGAPAPAPEASAVPTETPEAGAGEGDAGEDEGTAE
ncbi:MAG TPA: hypothetical protein RMH85_18590 [Polyangiaceae bacterium LLY-WYZ-15_(1-7)]|nr:hypothetical protein [Sandaracinus sp.]HJL04297.1 hypothetical protein [Polyangiaceae bacterium LLY-WYZ-15_(1-7)]HJL10516.1 hypothetical protein [Polyangiaceae bacterium LLY-WYZ-15_(1-7)]HJL25563.1 hypothetical protein [Polyangiaceae bacterium LLY-WYZ-15_(1-7)]HJL29679.1 hypothetical protein [Polyangiaceae bacterium LLY-WYZ-15_(1-7)]